MSSSRAIMDTYDIPLPTLTPMSTIRKCIDSQSRLQRLETMEFHVSQLETYICHLRTIRNHQTAFSDLPKEILAMILVEATYPTPQRRREWEYFPLSWGRHVELTPVCRLWRSVALDCPRFWAGIPFVPSPRFYPEMLARSMNYPLTVRINESHFKPNRKEAWEVLRAHLPALLNSARLEEVHLQMHALFMQELLEPSSETQSPRWVSAPRLRCLNISVIDDPETHSQLHWVPRQFLECSMPVLQHLTLMGCHTEWEEFSEDNFPQNLLSIHLSNNGLSPYHLHTLLKGSSTTLLALTYSEAESWHTGKQSWEGLKDPYEPDKKSSKPTPQPVFFPALQEYRFGCSVAHCVYLYDWFSPPDKAQAAIEVSKDLDSSIKESSQLPLVRSLFATWGLSTQRSSRPHSSLSLRFLSIGDLTLQTTSAFGRFQISLPREWIRSILESVSVQGLREIKIEGFVNGDNSHYGSVYKEVWASFYYNHPSVTRVHVSGKDSESVLLGLGCLAEIPGTLAAYRKYHDKPKDWEHPDIPNTILPFPLLRTLYVEGQTNDENRSRGYWHEWRSIKLEGATDYLESLLIDRWNYGMPIHRLRLRRFFHIHEYELDRLQRIAGEPYIKWDGMYPNQDAYDEEDWPVVIDDMDVADFDDPESSESESE